MKRLNTVRVIAALGCSMLLSVSSAAGRVLLQEDYRAGVAAGLQRGGQVDAAAGWRSPGGDADTGGEYLEYDLASLGLSPSQGTIEFMLRRDEVMDPEAVFSFADSRGNRLFVFRLYWEDFLLGGNVSSIGFYAASAANYWYTGRRVSTWTERVDAVSLGRRVSRGEWIHLAVAWGGIGGPAIYLDGRKLASTYDEPFSLPVVIAAASKLIVGAETSTRIPGGAWSMTRSPIRSLRVHDVALGPAELSAGVYANSVAAEKTAYGVGQEITVTLRGAMDKKAAFTVAGVASDVAMAEVDDGVYVGKVTVPAGVSLASAALTGMLTDPATGESAALAGASIAIDGTAPAAPGRIVASVPWAGEVAVSWEASAAGDVDHYLIFRGEGAAPNVQGGAYEAVKGLTFTDTAVLPGLTYQYVVVAVDRAGNAGPPSEIVADTAVAGEGPAITGITVEPFGKPVKPGQSLNIRVVGQSGGAVTIDLAGIAAGLALTEQGRTGTYAGTYVLHDKDVGPTKGLHRVVAHLSDSLGKSDLAGPEVAVVGLDALNDVTPPAVAMATHDAFQVAGFSGKLVAGDVVTVTLEGEPAGYASFELSEVAGRVAMNEVSAGVYRGQFTVPWGAGGDAVPLTAYLADEGGNETAVVAERTLAFDTRVRLTVEARDALLPADKVSQTRLTAKARNANGDTVQGHELALTLSTTEEYTGVVGGGSVEGRLASMDDVDDVEVKWDGTTDGFGEVSATYTAGFAAKTALLVAKDLTTGDVGAGWLNTYVASTVAIELAPRAAKGAEDRAILRIAADPAKLTADGRSTSRVKVWLTDLSGSPIAGARVAFALGNENGRLRVIRGTTDAKGVAEADYRAGTSIGQVTVTASAAEYGVTASVQILLLADAPAKIELVASTAKLVANGSDKATLSIRVSDVHDNPNDSVPVTFALLQGSGRVSAAQIVTNRLGEGNVTFTAGTTAGLAVIEARHTSRAPTDEELMRVYGTVFVPRWYERQERDRMALGEWKVKTGDKVEKGQVLVTLDTRTGARDLVAPAKGVFVREVRHERDRVELGDTVGYVEIDPEVWTDEYKK